MSQKTPILYIVVLPGFSRVIPDKHRKEIACNLYVNFIPLTVKGGFPGFSAGIPL